MQSLRRGKVRSDPIRRVTYCLFFVRCLFFYLNIERSNRKAESDAINAMIHNTIR